MSIKMSEVMEVVHRYAPKDFKPKFGMILGSGLSALAEQMTHLATVPYQAIPGLQSGGVAGHASMLIMGYLNDVPVVCLQGRLHVYEGASYDSIKALVRIVKQLGADALVVTGAVGSLRENVGAGEIVMLTDHINFHPGNPLVGKNDETFGSRFFSMDDAYNSELREAMQTAAGKLGIPMHEGVYISTLGPSFETPAEIRAYRQWGADVVGMSVVPEVLIARHCGLRVAGLTAVTNLAAGMSDEKITHEATLHYGEIAARRMVKIIPQFIKDSVSNGLVGSSS